MAKAQIKASFDKDANTYSIVNGKATIATARKATFEQAVGEKTRKVRGFELFLVGGTDVAFQAATMKALKEHAATLPVPEAPVVEISDTIVYEAPAVNADIDLD